MSLTNQLKYLFYGKPTDEFYFPHWVAVLCYLVLMVSTDILFGYFIKLPLIYITDKGRGSINPISFIFMIVIPYYQLRLFKDKMKAAMLPKYEQEFEGFILDNSKFSMLPVELSRKYIDRIPSSCKLLIQIKQSLRQFRISAIIMATSYFSSCIIMLLLGYTRY